MKTTFGIRLESDIRGVLSLASNLTHSPASKLISPFIEEGAKVLLGSLLLLMVDREAVIDRRMVKDLIDECTGAVDEPLSTTPPIIKRMEEILNREEVQGILRRVFPQVDFSSSPVIQTKGMLRELLKGMGEDYLKRGGSLSTLDMKLAVQAFFTSFLEKYYRSCARGNMDVLLSSWRTGSRNLLEIQQGAYRIYTKEVKLTPVEAIEIGVFQKRG